MAEQANVVLPLELVQVTNIQEVNVLPLLLRKPLAFYSVEPTKTFSDVLGPQKLD